MSLTTNHISSAAELAVTPDGSPAGYLQSRGSEPAAGRTLSMSALAADYFPRKVAS
jgi:hypothetical protein